MENEVQRKSEHCQHSVRFGTSLKISYHHQSAGKKKGALTVLKDMRKSEVAASDLKNAALHVVRAVSVTEVLLWRCLYSSHPSQKLINVEDVFASLIYGGLIINKAKTWVLFYFL